MDAHIVPYIFESTTIRTVTDEQGEALFCANDVCAVLEYSNPHKAVADHVEIEDLTKRAVLDSNGKTRQTNFINESGLYSLIIGCKLPAAKRFKRWITSEVLPSIRKTGSYTANPSPVANLPSHLQDTVAAMLFIGDAIGRVPGVNPAIATAAALTMIKDQTGIDTEPMRRCLPALQTPVASLNATAIGERVGMSAKRVNRALAARGLQIRNNRGEWELTTAGLDYGEAMPFANNGHSGYQVLWRESVIYLLVQ